MPSRNDINMDQQYQAHKFDDLMVAKKRKDSATDGPTSQSPISDSVLHRTLDSSLVLSGSFSNNGHLSGQDTHTLQMEAKILREFDSVNTTLIGRMTIESFSDYIARERLSSMPHRGSLWDRVLRCAESYALQIADYAQKIGTFVAESEYAARQIYTLLRTLIELGESNAAALNTAFGIFYKLGLSLSFLSSHGAQFSLSSDVRDNVCRIFQDVHMLVYDVASHYQGSARGLFNGSFTLDITSIVQEHLNNFDDHKSRIVNQIWTHALGSSASRRVQEVRKWLEHRTALLRSISAESLTHASCYDEYTCEWFQRHLLEFTRGEERILAITSPPGCGKSVLSSWIQERLQRPLDRKSHNTIMFSFDSNIPSGTTSLTLAKSLALQLMDIHMGNVQMFGAMAQAYNSTNAAEMEDHLWNGIKLAFSELAEPTMIIIDGLDQLQDNKSKVCEHISKLSAKHCALKTIILTRSETLPETTKTWRKFEIKSDHVHEDVYHIAKNRLRSCAAYQSMKDSDRHKTLDRVVARANGSFLWMLLAIDVLKPSKSPEEFEKILEKLEKTSPSLEAPIEQLTARIDLADDDMKRVLSYMLVTERPLSVEELYNILQVDIQRKVNTQRDINLRSKLGSISGLLQPNNLGTVRFLHPAVREHFISIQAKGEKLLPSKETHTDLTLRLLTYIKVCLDKPHDVSLEPLEYAKVERLITEHGLLEYAVRHWTAHLRQSTLYKPSGILGFSPDVKAAFSSSPCMSLLEWTCWDEQFPPNELLSLHELSLRVRIEVFQEKHTATLQNIITCAHVYHMHSSPTSAAVYFARASRVCQQVLSKFSRTTITCTETFLTITNSMKFSSRTELVTYREEMLRFVITAYKHTHGETSDTVVHFHRVLAELYVSIHEDDNAAECWKELRIIIIKKHGEGSEFEREISGKLMVVLRSDKDFDIRHYHRHIFAVGKENAVVWNTARIMMFFKLAQGCEHRKELHEAEELYVTLWTRLLHLCRHESSEVIEVRISMLQIAIEYVCFLHRQQRIEEAKNILIVIWTEHKHFGCESESFYQQLTIIGKLMRTLELHYLSISVFERVLSFFKAVGKYDSSYARECEDTMIAVIQESTERQSSSSHSSSSTEAMETIVRRMFSSSSVISKETIKVARSAVHLHMKYERWSEAIVLLTETLNLMGFTGSWGGEVCLPNDYVDEAIEFALDLGKCYSRCKRHQESLSVYLQLWQSVRSSCGIDDKRRTIILDVLIQIYTEHKRWRALVELRKELLVEYRRHFGKSHERIIGLLYILGDLTLEHGHGYPEDYYREIVDVIGISNSKLSFKAYKRLSLIYYDESNWVELKIVCDVLWTLLTTQAMEHDFDDNYIELLYIRYIYLLKHHHRGNGKADHEHMVVVARQYKEMCILKFGTQSSIAIQARIAYASVLMEDETTKNEAISAYEEVITTTRNSKTSIDESTIVVVKKKLTEAYVHVHHKGISSSETTEKAILVLQERFQLLRKSLGYAHAEVLSIFTELISMRCKIKKTAEHEQAILGMLQEHALEIIVKEKRSQALFEAANTLGAMYIACGYHSQGLELVYAARRLVITGHTHEGQNAIKLDKSVGRIAFVFLVTFELMLKGSLGHGYSEIMADWLTESVLFENYSRSLSASTKTELLFLRSAHLRSFWFARSRHDEIEILDRQILDLFCKQFGNTIKVRPEMTSIFLTSVLIYIGANEAYDIQLAKVASIAGNDKVEMLVKAGKWQEALEVGHCVFHFVMTQGGYQQADLIGHGFKLAKNMAAKGNMSVELHGKLLHTSREIMTEVLAACKTLQINFLQLHDHELNDLVELLGEQENYKELENILESLWKSRHGQKHWSEDTLINLGVRLVMSRHLASGNGHSHNAIHLAEDMTYNLRRVLGGLHPHTLEMSKLLSQLYTSAKLYGEALTVHEEILQLIVSGDDGDDRTTDTVSAVTARRQLNLLKAAYQRNGGWVKSPDMYKKLVNQLIGLFTKNEEFKNCQPVREWQAKLDSTMANVGIFEKPTQWEFVVEEDVVARMNGGAHDHDGVNNGGGGSRANGNGRVQQPVKKGKRTGWSLRRISDLWGMNMGEPRVGNLDTELTI